VVAALVARDDVLLLEAAVDADVEVLVPPAVLGNAVSATVEGPVLANAVSATVEGPGVLVFTALAVCSIQLGQKCCWAQVLTVPWILWCSTMSTPARLC